MACSFTGVKLQCANNDLVLLKVMNLPVVLDDTAVLGVVSLLRLVHHHL